MRIVDRKTFLTLPKGTVFMKFTPQIFGTICIKGDTIDVADVGDFTYTDFETPDTASDTETMDLLDAAATTDTTFRMSLDLGSRDGLFDEDQLFAVFQISDLDRMIHRLAEARRSVYRINTHPLLT